MRKIISLLLIMISSMALFSSDLTFSGGRSSLNLMEGKEEVVLSEGAEVSIDSIRIESDKITLRGSGWNEVLCQGKTTIVDSEHNLEIRASSIWFDRTSERILISSWFEIDDSENEISATGNSMEFDMKNKVLKLDKDVTLLKITDKGIMKCKAESVIYDRESEKLSLRGNASVVWGEDEYHAQAISVDLSTEAISLEGRIKGTING